MSALVVVLTLCFPVLFAASIACKGPFSCANKSTTGDMIQNSGYKSHYGILSTITASSQVQCFGAYSCAKSALLYINEIPYFPYSIPYYICHGTFSCSNIAEIRMIAHINMDAYGNNALTESYINCEGLDINNGSNDIDCSGAQSCAYATFQGCYRVTAFGDYSFMFATFDTNFSEPRVSTLILQGFYAGFGANFICRAGNNCSITCYGATSCINLNLICESGSNCTLLGDHEPFTTNVSLNDILLYDIQSLSQHYETLCAQSDAITFDRNQQHYRDILENVNKSAICCRSYMACASNYIDYRSDSNTSIVCTGIQSCFYSDIYHEGDMFCGGSHSCSNSNITATDTVYCGGYNSCARTNFNAVSKIYCSSRSACINSSFVSNGVDLNVYFTSYAVSRYGVTIVPFVCNEGDICSIFCGGYRSCEGVSLLCNGTCIVECDRWSLCPERWTRNTTTPTVTVYTSNTTTLDIKAITSEAPSSESKPNALGFMEYVAICLGFGVICCVCIIAFLLYKLKDKSKQDDADLPPIAKVDSVSIRATESDKKGAIALQSVDKVSQKRNKQQVTENKDDSEELYVKHGSAVNTKSMKQGEEDVEDDDEDENLYDHEGLQRIDVNTRTKQTPLTPVISNECNQGTNKTINPQSTRNATDFMKNVEESDVGETQERTRDIYNI